MAAKIKVDTKPVEGAIRLQSKRYGADPVSRYVVGYKQEYAVFVHENLEAHHPVGQAKFLEQPARTMAKELAALIRGLLKAGKALRVALLTAGLKLQAASQKLCPVDTGALKNSAFTKLE